MAHFEVRLVWPPFKGKAYKVVDTTNDDRGVALVRTATGAKRIADRKNREARA